MKSYRVRNLRAGILFAILGIGIALAIGGLFLLPKLENSESFLILIWLYLLCLVALGYVAVKKLTAREQIVTLTDKTISIRSTGTIKEQSIPLLQIKSYLYEGYGEGKSLALRLHSGKKIVFRHNDSWGEDDFCTLVADLDKVFNSLLSDADGLTMAIPRESSFYERPIAGIVGWSMLTLMVFLTGFIVLRGTGEAGWDTLLMIYSSASLYLGPWLAARKWETPPSS